MVCSAGSLSMVYMGFSAIWVVNGGWFLLQEILSGWSSSPSPCCCGCCYGPDETVSGHVHRYCDSSFFDWTCGPSQTAAMQRTCCLLHRFAHRVDQSEAAYGARLPVRVHGNRCGCSWCRARWVAASQKTQRVTGPTAKRRSVVTANLLHKTNTEWPKHTLAASGTAILMRANLCVCVSVSYTVFSGSGRNLSCGILMPSGWSVRYNTIQYNKSYAKDAWSWSGRSKLMCDGV